MESQKAFKTISVAVIDVRGTILHPYDDRPISLRIARAISRLLIASVKVCFNTAGSFDGTIAPLVLPRILEELGVRGATSAMVNLVAYVNSGCLALRFNCNGDAERLPNFTTLDFVRSELVIVEKAVSNVAKQYSLKHREVKVKTGQVNFYCGGNWDKRLRLAQALEAELATPTSRPISVMVPSAKNTIDIALTRKDRAIRDIMTRFDVQDSALLLLGDSFQAGGADVDMAVAAPRAVAVHVGTLPPHERVHHSNLTGTAGGFQTLVALCRSRGNDG